jgi:hypothetical protein
MGVEKYIYMHDSLESVMFRVGFRIPFQTTSLVSGYCLIAPGLAFKSMWLLVFTGIFEFVWEARAARVVEDLL